MIRALTVHEIRPQIVEDTRTFHRRPLSGRGRNRRALRPRRRRRAKPLAAYTQRDGRRQRRPGAGKNGAVGCETTATTRRLLNPDASEREDCHRRLRSARRRCQTKPTQPATAIRMPINHGRGIAANGYANDRVLAE